MYAHGNEDGTYDSQPAHYFETKDMDTRVSVVVQHEPNIVGEEVAKPSAESESTTVEELHAVMQQGHNAKTTPVKIGCMKKMLHEKCEKPGCMYSQMRRRCYRLPGICETTWIPILDFILMHLMKSLKVLHC